MALKRRSGNRFSANIWPGFVDAMTALLLVLMFVLTIFMIVQFVLRETITGQDEELNQLSQEIEGLSAALGLEKRKTEKLQGEVGTLNSSLAASRKTAQDRQRLIDTLSITNEKQAAKITDFETKVSSFETQVAGLLAQNSRLGSDLQASRAQITVLGSRNTTLQARNKTLGEEVQKYATQIAGLSAERESLNNRISALNKNEKDLRDRNKSLNSALVSGQKSRAELEAQNKELLAAAEQAAQTNADLSAENRKLAAKTQDQTKDQDRLEQQNQQLLADKDALEKANLKQISEKEAVQLALAQARDEISESVENARLAAAKTEALQALLAEIRTEASQKENSLADALAALAQAEASADTSQSELGNTRTELAGTKTALDKAQTRLAQLDGDLSDSRKTVARLRSALAKTRVEMAALQENGTGLQGQLKGAKQTVKTLQNALTTARGRVAALEGELKDSKEILAGSRDALKETRAALNASNAALKQARAKGKATVLSEEQLRKRVEQMAKGLSETVKNKLAEAAAAAALRARLKNAQDELTAMTLSLEAERKKAEDTLTLLAAADAAKKQVSEQASQALSEKEKTAALLAVANTALAKEKALSAESQRKVELLNKQTAKLRKQLDDLQGVLDQSNARDVASKVQIETLGSNLNAALAQVAAKQKKLAQEQRARADLEEKERKRLEAETKDLKKFRSEFFGRLRDVLGKQDGIRIVGDRFVFSSEILFDPASAELGPRGQAEIRKVAGTLFAVADQIPNGIDWILRVDGHTDNRPLSGLGKYKDNWELSQARALAVVRYLINDLGIPANRLAANGFGEYQPLVKGDSPEALAQNRRIELKFTER